MTMPPRLVEALLGSAFQQRMPAYLSVTRKGYVHDVGGAWDRYWHDSPAPPGLAAEVLPFLVGLLPVGPQAEFLPRVALGYGPTVDIYLVPDDDLDWVLLVDAGDLDHARRYQQARHIDHLHRSQRPSR